jgi:hypothetical protein
MEEVGAMAVPSTWNSSVRPVEVGFSAENDTIKAQTEQFKPGVFVVVAAECHVCVKTSPGIGFD